MDDLGEFFKNVPTLAICMSRSGNSFTGHPVYNEKCSLISRIPQFFCYFLIHKIKLITAIHQLPYSVSIRYFFGMDSESSMDRSRKSTEKIKLFIFIRSMNNSIYAEVCDEMLTHNKHFYCCLLS